MKRHCRLPSLAVPPGQWSHEELLAVIANRTDRAIVACREFRSRDTIELLLQDVRDLVGILEQRGVQQGLFEVLPSRSDAIYGVE